MKTIGTLITTLLLLSILFFSCTANDENETTCFKSKPLEELNWLKEMKSVLSQNKDNTQKKIVQYTYNNDTVFVVNTCVDCIDSVDKIYNCSGKMICEIGKKISYNNCPEFYKKASNKKILWRNYNEVIVNKNLYNKVKTDNYTIKNASQEGNILKVTLSAGGCDGNSWIVNLIDSSDILESDPIQRNIKIELQNNEVCEALITKEFIFDITKLKHNGKPVVLNLAKWENVSILGNWSNSNYNDKTGETTLERMKILPKGKYGMMFNKKNIFVERSSGWCATPPLTFNNEKGTWQLKGDTLIIKRQQGHYMGNNTFLIKKLSKKQLVLKKIQSEQEKELAEINKLYDEIHAKFISKIKCSSSNELKAIPYGNKACGGPKGYLPFLTTMKDSATYLALVKKFTKLQSDYNKKWGIVSDCAVVTPPTKITCENGNPVFKYN